MSELDGPSVIWFRHGLRIHDNPALFEAIKSDGNGRKKLIPVFIFDGDSADAEAHGGYKISSKYNKFLRLDVNNEETTAEYWRKLAQQQVYNKLMKLPNYNLAKNIILFLGDGMSLPTLTAARIYKGQKEGLPGENSKLYMESMPYTGLSKTYCVSHQVADSACSATAYLCGVKANFFTAGVSAKVSLNECEKSNDPQNQVNSIADWAQKANKSAGIVTTTTVTHASPSGSFAHTSNRMFESDADVITWGGNNNCQDIASQLVLNEPGNRFKVILGGGRKKFLPNTTRDEQGERGERLDDKNLIKSWLKEKRRKSTAKYVSSRSQLKLVDYSKTDYLMGLFSSGHMKYHLDNDGIIEPTLPEMTEAAIKILEKNQNGYFLFVEGGRIDHAHHEAKARQALEETIQFDNAIKLAREITSESNTLIVVTSDHAHTMSISGYPNRGNNILGLNSFLGKDGLPYTTLSYANGPGYKETINGVREDLTYANLNDKDYVYGGLFPTTLETHGGDDVGIFASGPWAHLFVGFLEQNVIPHLMAFASCIGNGLTACGFK